jgi:nanoRNase/pAp phosphatase (c-di-AMP/oligoRNAs hydrolase)
MAPEREILERGGGLRYIILCDDELPFHFVGLDHKQEILFLCEDSRLQKRLSRRGAKCRCGKLRSRAIYQRLKICPADRIGVFLRDEKDQGQVLQAVMEHTDVYAITLVEERTKKKRPAASMHPRVRSVPMVELVRDGLINELEKTIRAAQLRTLRSIFHDQERVLLLVQYDPDPDAVASALAMRTLLGRNKLSAPIATFGKVTRPENLAMLKLLDIEVIQIGRGELEEYNRIVLLDVQPSHFREELPPVHVIIDHHPENENAVCLFKDIRPNYGATSTILQEYLHAGDVKITQKLATALLYGIKTDTLLLEREAIENDLRAFSILYPMANHRLIRRMERPQLPKDDLSVLSKAFHKPSIVEDVIYVHLDDLTREDIVPYIADFCLEVEGIEWAVVSGVYDRKVVVSARNYGTTRSAGELMRAAFSAYGSAGGHRSMAKAVIPLDALDEKDARDPQRFLLRRFLEVYQAALKSLPLPRSGAKNGGKGD